VANDSAGANVAASPLVKVILFSSPATLDVTQERDVEGPGVTNIFGFFNSSFFVTASLVK
jgi:hypothetical protein